VDRPSRAYQIEDTPQGSCIELRASCIVPLVQASVTVPLVAIEPELRDQAREPDEQRGVEDALPEEERVPAAAVHLQPELDHEQARVFGRITVDHRLSEHPRRRRVGEAKSHPDVLPREVGATPDKQPHRGGRAAHDGAGRDGARKRLLRLQSGTEGSHRADATARAPTRFRRTASPRGGQALGTVPRRMPSEGQQGRPPTTADGARRGSNLVLLAHVPGGPLSLALRQEAERRGVPEQLRRS